MMRRTSLAVLASAVVVTATSTHGQTKRFVTEKDLLRFTWIADPQISPDGSTVAFVRVTVNEKENRYETSVFAVAASGSESARRLTSGIRDTTPRWSPDGKRIAFVGTLRGKPIRSYSRPDLWVMDVPGSEPGRGLIPTPPKNLTAGYDFDIGGDQAAPRGGTRKPIVWARDPSTGTGQAAWSLIVVTAEKGSANLNSHLSSSAPRTPLPAISESRVWPRVGHEVR